LHLKKYARALLQEGISDAFYEFVRLLLFANVTTHCAYTKAFFVNDDQEQFIASPVLNMFAVIKTECHWLV